MAQTGIDTVKAKLNEVKQQSEDMQCLYSAFIDTVTVAIDKVDGHTESTNMADIHAKLDVVSGVLSGQYEESSRLMTELAAPCDHKADNSKARTLSPECQTVLPSQDCSQTVLPSQDCSQTVLPSLDCSQTVLPSQDCSQTVLPSQDCSQTVLPSQDCSQTVLPSQDCSQTVLPSQDSSQTVLPSQQDSNQTVLPSQDSSQSDLAQFASRLKALETAVSTLTASVQETTLHQQAAKAEQDNAFQTSAETLTNLISCEIDSLDAKLQQMILNCSDKLDFQGWGIRTINNQISSVQTAFWDFQTWKQMTSELTSRLYTLEDTTNRFIKNQESGVNTKPLAQINDKGVKDENDMGVKSDK